MVQNGRHFIQNTWVEGTGTPFSSFNPGTGEILWEGAAASPEECIAALQSAREAFEPWSKLTMEARYKYIRRFKDLLKDREDSMAILISKEVGKPLWESKTEVSAMIRKIPISEESYKERSGIKISSQGGKQYITRHKPHGVIVVLGPFNFPGHLPNGHIVPALLAGNTIVFKPSNQTPAVADFMLSLWEEVGLPPGVLNMVHGGAIQGQLLATHPNIDGLFFTGSYGVGKHLSGLFSRHPEKILALEMGGNNPLVVSQITDTVAAAYMTVQSAYITSGQRCTCARRLIVVESKKNKLFVKDLVDMISKIKVGSYNDVPEPFMGPVISTESSQHLLASQHWLINMGGRALAEIVQLQDGLPFISPGLIDVTKLTDLPDDELFGPLLKLIWVPNLEAGIEEANRTNYGLSASLFSKSEEEFRIFSEKTRAGVVNWNTQTTGASSGMPFGGVGASGNNRPSAYYAADYCSYPVASIESAALDLPDDWAPGVARPSDDSKKK